MVEAHPYASTEVSDFQVDDRTYKYYSLPALGEERYAKLPYSIRVLLESAVRNCDNFNVKRKSLVVFRGKSMDFVRNEIFSPSEISIPLTPLVYIIVSVI